MIESPSNATCEPPFISRLLIATTFGVVASSFAWCVVDEREPQIWRFIPVCSGVGAAVTTFFVWKWIAGRTESMVHSGCAGLLVGLFAHPVSAAVSCVVFLGADMLGLTPGESGLSSIADGLAFAFWWIVLWSLCASVSIAWMSAGVGAVCGLVIGAIYRGMRVLDNQRRLSDITDEANRHELSRRLVLDEHPWDSWRAGIVSLAIMSVLSVSMIMQFADGASPEQHAPLIQKPAPLDEQAMDFSEDQQQ